MSETHPQPARKFTSLVQHIALNESGWWEHAVERLVLASCYASGVDTRAITENKVKTACGLQHPNNQITKAIDRLVEDGSLVEFDGTLRLAESIRTELESEELSTLLSEERVQNRFIALVRQRGIEQSPEDLWTRLETEIVLPTVKLMGARLYGLLNSEQYASNGDLEARIRDLSSNYDEALRSLFADFLDPRDSDTRAFVLRRLNAQYAIDAAALPEDTLIGLQKSSNRASRVDIFLDTNVLFSVLGLHENPNDATANQFLGLVEDIRSNIDIRLFVVPETIRETETVLGDFIRRLARFRGQPNLAEAAQIVNAQGLMSRYLTAVKDSDQTLTAEEFFGPYQSDLLPILRSKGVELFNHNLSALHTNQAVIDDLHDQVEIQERVRPKGAKPYEANIHDMVLWHFVANERRAVAESLLEVNSWIVTLDYGLIRFDRSKRRTTRSDSVCLDPATLIQMLQFWIPSGVSLDEALVGSLREPLLFLPFDVESEQVTVRILNQLSRYENIGDLETEVVADILTNDALRNRLVAMKPDHTEDEVVVREEIAHVAQQWHNELKELRSELREAEVASKQSELERSARESAERSLEQQRTSSKKIRTEYDKLSTRLSKREAQLQDVLKLNAKLAARLEAQDLTLAKRSGVRRIVIWALVATGLGLVVASASIVLAYWIGLTSFAWFGGFAIGLWVTLYSFERHLNAAQMSEALPTNILRRVQSLRKAWWLFVTAVIASIVADILV